MNYPGGPLIPSSLHDLLGDDVVKAGRRLFSLTGFDAFRSPKFWEAHIAQRLGSDTTKPTAPHDVEVEVWGYERTIEVKFSSAFYADYGTYSRYVFKWLLTPSQVNVRSADTLVLVGIDVNDLVYGWVLPMAFLPPRKRSILVTAPSDRRRKGGGRIDEYSVPLTEVLPAVAAINPDDRPPLDLVDWIESQNGDPQ